MLDFIGFALIVQLLLAITIEMARDMFSEHRRKLARLLNLPTSFVLLVRTLTAKVLHWTAVDYKGRARDTAIDRLQSFREANPANPTHLVVFVRGTFGGPGYDSRWDRLATALTTVHPHTAFFCFLLLLLAWPQ